MSTEAWIIDAVRSPRGKGKETGSLHPVHPQRILAQVLNALRDRNNLDTADVDDVVMGCGAGSGDHSMDIARMAALDAGWSLDAPGVTLNRFCGSGQQAVNFAAMGVLSGFQDVVVGGGVESMSRPAPMHVDGFTANNNHLRDIYAMVAQGISGADGAEIDHIELFGPDDTGADSRNFVLCPGGAYDRSPCGTGTSAKVACLAADGKLAPGAVWTQASIIGSRFEASYSLDNGQVIPTIRGRAHISAKATLLLDPQDPFVWGIRL
jgi:hypothetical protein